MAEDDVSQVNRGEYKEINDVNGEKGVTNIIQFFSVYH